MAKNKEKKYTSTVSIHYDEYIRVSDMKHRTGGGGMFSITTMIFLKFTKKKLRCIVVSSIFVEHEKNVKSTKVT